ncbi:MAG: integrase core domain-containing protein [Gammaproteobacteria bacterium]
MGIEDVVTAPRSSWQSPYVERVIGSIRRACLNHVIVLNERDLRWILSSYLDYYHRSRTHLSLGKDCPEPRPEKPSGPGKIVAFPQVGGLHHCMNVSRLDPSRGPDPAVSSPVGSHRSRRPPSLPRHAVARLNHSFNDGCVTFGPSHGPVAIHISAIEGWAEPQFGPD